jgi:hypothetical protein
VAPQAAPVAGGRPGARGQWSQGLGRRAGAGVAGELLPRASRTQERWLDLVAGRRTCWKRVQNHRIDLADARARRAELRRELDDPPSEVRGLIERHEQLRGWRMRIR